MTEPEPLLDRTKKLLSECDLSLPVLAGRAGVGYEWLKKFASGDVPDPRVKRLQKLHDYLARQQACPTVPAESRDPAQV
jgi:predicted transcriptional regulator